MTSARAQEEAGTRVEHSGPAILQPLRVRNFRLVWLGESVSLLGDEFYFVALAWLTLLLTGSGLALGGVLTVAAVPRALLMLFGGAITDRIPPRRLMLASNSVRAVLVGIVTGLIFLGIVQIWQLYILALAFGTMDAVFFPASASITPTLVDEARLTSANALMQISTQVMTLLGPGMAGLLIATAGRKVGSGTAFALDALSFAFASLMLVLVRYDHRVVAVAQVGEQAPDRDGSGLWQSVFEGLRYCWSDPVLRALLVIIAATNFAFTGPFTVGLASLAHSRFAGGSVAFGIMLSGWGAGAVVGTLAGGSLGQPRRRGRIVLSAVVLLGAGLVALGFVPNVVIATAAIVAMGCGGGFINVIMLPWLQTRADPRFVGRVMSVVMFAAVALAPISYALAGLLVDVNAEILFAAAGGLVLGAAIIAGAREPVRSID